jgi:antitoxin (DNA-binding transcriptional repressor) of toxin-antitoxin stability system
MPLFSASEDFTRRTLSAISGLLSRLAYITSLRDEKGTYRHWGLARTHGDAAAAEAMCRAHMEVLTEVLRTPLSQLMREVEDPQQVALGVPQVLLKKSAPVQSIVPAGAHAATLSHAKATILALRALQDARNRRQTTHRAA